MPNIDHPQAQTTIGIGDFACVPVEGAGGWAISLGELFNGSGKWSGYDHAFIYDGWWASSPPDGGNPAWRDGEGPGYYVFEAMPGGARRRKLDCKPEEIHGALWSTGYVPLGVDQRMRLYEWSQRLLGTPYSVTDYMALAAHRLHLPGGDRLKSFVASNGHMICSQLVDYMHNQVGSHLFSDGRWCGYVTPFDLAQLIRERMVERTGLAHTIQKRHGVV